MVVVKTERENQFVPPAKEGQDQHRKVSCRPQKRQLVTFGVQEEAWMAKCGRAKKGEGTREGGRPIDVAGLNSNSGPGP